MKYYVYDEEGLMIRCFQSKSEAVAFLQPGWSYKFVKIEKPKYEFEEAPF